MPQKFYRTNDLVLDRVEIFSRRDIFLFLIFEQLWNQIRLMVLMVRSDYALRSSPREDEQFEKTLRCRDVQCCTYSWLLLWSLTFWIFGNTCNLTALDCELVLRPIESEIFAVEVRVANICDKLYRFRLKGMTTLEIVTYRDDDALIS